MLIGGTHFREVLLSKPTLLILGKVVANDLARDLDGKVDDGVRELDRGLAALGIDSAMRLCNDASRLVLRLGKNLGTLLLGLLLGLRDNLLCLAVGVDELILVALGLSSRLCL